MLCGNQELGTPLNFLKDLELMSNSSYIKWVMYSHPSLMNKQATVKGLTTIFHLDLPHILVTDAKDGTLLRKCGLISYLILKIEGLKIHQHLDITFKSIFLV